MIDEDRVREIYDQVHKEYNAWRKEYAEMQMKSLASQPLLPTINLPLPVHTQSNLTCTDYDANEDELTTTNLTPITVTCPPSLCLEPTPKYECCALCSTNIFSLPAPDLGEGANFIRFADQPEMKDHIDKYIRQYTRLNRYKKPSGFFEWEENVPKILEADYLAIRLETTRRLLAEPDFTYADLDSLSDDSLKHTVRYEDVKNRDIIWQGSEDALSLLCSLDEQMKEKSDLLQDLDRGLQFFCANLNCITSACRTHPLQKYAEQNEVPWLEATPKKTSSELRQMRLECCGAHCFLIVDDDELEDLPATDADLLKADKDIESIILFMPDELPCIIASFCSNIECQSIYAYRKRLFPDDEIRRQRQRQKEEPPKKTLPKWRTDAQVGEKRVGPCSHTGSCNDLAVRCVCREGKQYCLRNCRCDPTCKYRLRRGCGCHAKNKPSVPLCGTDDCNCYKNGRECDQQYCKSCSARDAIFEPNQRKYVRQKKLCKNVSLQRGVAAGVEIARSQWGFGAFATEDIPGDCFIGEYTGEIFSDAQQRENYWTDVKQRTNYRFNFESTLTLDAAQIGNHTRFLNDAVESTKEGRMKENNSALNCYAILRVVNGQTRLGVYAEKRISRGEELLLSYGDTYWRPNDQKTEGEETTDSTQQDSESDSTGIDVDQESV